MILDESDSDYLVKVSKTLFTFLKKMHIILKIFQEFFFAEFLPFACCGPSHNSFR